MISSCDKVLSFDLDAHSTVDTSKVLNNSKIFQSTTSADASKKPLFSSSDTVMKPLPTIEQNNDTAINENLTTLITEQRRQNRLLEQVIAAINTTNSLLTQLVQR